ncbi:Hypothetical predicted protein [Pelobates cultripes]|uniref:Uncharacterized protein n=1 Tax=Pelobates cultripes TaxID=61616 RepID=A0AAD1WNM5_PELCU|nr:Hypothetical predicted protein [Pelobates cultripes]
MEPQAPCGVSKMAAAPDILSSCKKVVKPHLTHQVLRWTLKQSYLPALHRSRKSALHLTHTDVQILKGTLGTCRLMTLLLRPGGLVDSRHQLLLELGAKEAKIGGSAAHCTSDGRKHSMTYPEMQRSLESQRCWTLYCGPREASDEQAWSLNCSS